jgi:hypothetical protein
MNCKTWQNEIADHALGAPATPELREHLRACERCASELVVLQRRAEAIDAYLDRAMNVAPADDLRNRIVGAVSRPPEHTTSLGFRWAAAGLAAAVVGGLVVAGRFAQHGSAADPVITAAAEIPQWRSPTDSLLSDAANLVTAPRHKTQKGSPK